ncbi:hypothetical protein JCM17960_17590 [Magnetospira thiophila]
MKVHVMMMMALVLTGSLARAEGPSFTADAVSRVGDEVIRSFRYLHGEDAVRLELEKQGHHLVQIVKTSAGKMWVIDPDKKTYMEFAGNMPVNSQGARQVKPCEAPPPGFTCEALGKQKAGAFDADAYRISGSQDKAQSSTVYWDPQSKQVVRQETSDGKVMQAEFVGRESIMGRDTEHWRATYTEPNQLPQIGDWWLDTQLGTRIREALPTGEVRELKNIQVGTIDSALFEVPPGYTKIQPPAGPSSSPGQPGGSGARPSPYPPSGGQYQRQPYPPGGGQYRYPNPNGQ